jgi:hypothetical protein
LSDQFFSKKHTLKHHIPVVEAYFVVNGTPAVNADGKGLRVSDPEAGLYRQIAGHGSAHVNGVANLYFLLPETIVGILHRGAHVYAAEADFKIKAGNFYAASGSRSDGVFVVGLRIGIIGVPARGGGPKFFGKLQRINRFAGIETQRGKWVGFCHLMHAGKRPFHHNGLLGKQLGGNKKQRPRYKVRYVRARKKIAEKSLVST